MTEKLEMPKGRLRVRDDLNSPIVGLWGWKTEPNTAMGALERSYLAAIDTASKVSARRNELKGTGKYTDSGVAEQLVPAALEAMKPLRKAQNAIARVKAELAERRGRLKLTQPDQTNIVAALERQEIRTWLRSLDQAQRDKLFLGGGERVTHAIAEAVRTAPPALSGVAPSNINLMKERALEAQFPGEIEALADMERAIEVTERAVNVNTTEILNEMGIMKEKLLELA